ncbi:thiol-disulfide oxidoreductase [Novipirellula artificiosorum]|uniref:Thiol-disulfide oxidoreductase n=2 Tax=Novipirellula artificiosorum TaxID=2528016 RepID=A0A5C6E5T1_9BACT|nr:thiol-disulfide oxidoreductase [Novipirellula artificiosorum]
MTPSTAMNSETPPKETSSINDAAGGLELPPSEDPALETSPEPPDKSEGLEMPPIDSDQSSTGARASDTIAYASWQEIEQQITLVNKLTVVDFWSLSCQPCLEEFPGLVRLNKELGDKVKCMSVDVDFDGRKSRPPESYEERIVNFLTSVGATFPTFISQTASDEIFAELELASIPAVFVYDAEGNLVKRFVDAGETAGFSYDEDVIPFVKSLAG